MTLHDDLLEQAQHLSRRERLRPKQASLRRSASAAYYALFHLLIAESAAVVGRDLSPAMRAKVQRWFSHSDMKKVCHLFLVPTFTKPASLAGFAPSTEVQLIARNFISLQGARHSADYDVSSQWTRLHAQQMIQLARSAFSAWSAIKGSEQANVFILALLNWKQFEAERP